MTTQRPTHSIPRKLGPYRLTGRIGKGGMNHVLKAEHEVLCREVALKVLPPQERADSMRARAFNAEAQAGAKVASQFVATSFDAGTAHGWSYLALEYVNGGDLRKMLKKRRGPLAPRLALALIKDVAKGLDAVHKAGFLHRDIKPANILMTKTMVPKLADFGIAVEKALPHDRSVYLGSPSYMAPEQLDRDPCDERTDLYLLAGTLYHLMVGDAPFFRRADDIGRVHCHRVVPPAHHRNRDLDRQVGLMLTKGLAEDPRRRFQTAREFIGAIEELLHPKPAPVAKPVASPEPAQPALPLAYAWQPAARLNPGSTAAMF